MMITKFGLGYEIDIHGMTVSDTKRELTSFLNRCEKQTTEIDIIHGCHGGTALLNFVRKDFKHKRIEKKILSLNNGMTTFKIKP